MNSYLSSSLKRSLDVFISVLVLPFALVLMIIGGILITLTTGGGVFYSQNRIGKNGKEFKILKLRTLVKNASGDLAGMTKNDPQIFWIGRHLRRWRIDELPQIFNILLGDMSWVGPRPERPHLVANFYKLHKDYEIRHKALPGITGLAQINLPDATPNDTEKKLPFDIEYVGKASFSMDLKIMWKTIQAIG
jgi:lipopolysaccharide/colanic/teichoic acid biosynthesis glycosyltransferase